MAASGTPGGSRTITATRTTTLTAKSNLQTTKDWRARNQQLEKFLSPMSNPEGEGEGEDEGLEDGTV